MRKRVLALLAAVILIPEAAAAQGEYLLLKDGTEVMSVKIRSAGAGRIAGEVSGTGQTASITGTISGESIAFTSTFSEGPIRWQGTINGSTFKATLTDPSGSSETFTLVRRGVGWSATAPLAQQWTRRLTGREIASTDRTGGESSGSAVKDMTIAFCAEGKAVYNERFALSISVPGMGGSQTSRKREAGHWRVISNGNTAAIELGANEREVFQMGIREASNGVIRVADQPMRLRDAAGKCSSR